MNKKRKRKERETPLLCVCLEIRKEGEKKREELICFPLFGL